MATLNESHRQWLNTFLKINGQHGSTSQPSLVGVANEIGGSIGSAAEPLIGNASGASSAGLIGESNVLRAGPSQGGSNLPGGGSGNSGTSSAPAKEGDTLGTNPPAKPAQRGPTKGEVLIPQKSGPPTFTEIQPDSSIVTIQTVNGPEKMTVDEYRTRYAAAEKWVSEQMQNYLSKKGYGGLKSGDIGEYTKQAAKKFGLDANWKGVNRTTVPGTNVSNLLPANPAQEPVSGAGGGGGPDGKKGDIGKAKTEVDPHGPTQKGEHPAGNTPPAAPKPSPAAPHAPESPGAPKGGGEPKVSGTPPASPPPDVPKTGNIKEGRVTVAYDFTGKEPSVTLKDLDLKDYPPDKEGKITGYFKDKVLLGGLIKAGANFAAGQAGDKMMEAVQSHFHDALQAAKLAFSQAYPTPGQLRDEANLEEFKETYQVIVDYVGEPAHAFANRKIPKDLANNLEGAFAYENAMIELETRVQQLKIGLPELGDDIEARATVLFSIKENLEQAFAYIHTHLIGAIEVVYYQSFTLWSARGTFEALGGQVSGFANTIHARYRQYEELTEKLEKNLIEVGAELEPWRELYEKGKSQ